MGRQGRQGKIRLGEGPGCRSKQEVSRKAKRSFISAVPASGERGGGAGGKGSGPS